jgi:hypothetical protein
MSEYTDESITEDPYAALRSSVKTTAGNTGKYFEMLTVDEKSNVTAFISWLKTTTMSAASVNSYKSYVTKALLKSTGRLDGDLTNDEKSGVRKFLGWVDATTVSTDHEEE